MTLEWITRVRSYFTWGFRIFKAWTWFDWSRNLISLKWELKKFFIKQKWSLGLNDRKKLIFKKKTIEKNVQFVSNILLRIKKGKLMAVLMFFVFNALIIGVPNVEINVHFVEPYLLQLFIKMKMEIFVLKTLIF